MKPDGLSEILALAQAGLDDPTLSPEELAGRAHLSRFHFDRLVKATSGEAPGALRRRLLLERAAHRLIATDHTVLDIAVEAGYGSHEAFTRAFARAYGRPPREVRQSPPLTFSALELHTPNGVHFQPPGGLRLPAERKVSSMNIMLQMVEHHVSSLTTIIDAAAGLPDGVLDQPITLSVEALDDGEVTLRTTLNAMVTQEEHWLSAVRGGGWPDESDQSASGLAERHQAAGEEWVQFVRQAVETDSLGDTFVDTTCDDRGNSAQPSTHSIGSTIAHVITFAAVRRTLAVGALWSAGVRDFDLADPRPAMDHLAQTG